jgi:hypothetical protein
LNRIFHIPSTGQPEPVQKILSMCLGEKHFSYAVTGPSGNRLLTLGYYAGSHPGTDFLSALFSKESVLNQTFSTVKVAFQFSQSVLVPAHLYNPADASVLLTGMTGTTAGKEIFSDAVDEWQVQNVYAVPKQVYWWLNSRFQGFQHKHHHTAILQSGIKAGSNGIIFIDCRPDEFSAVVLKENTVLLAQTYSYATPEDVLYKLLKISSHFALPQEGVQILLSGMIEERSALFKEMYQYFLHIEFSKSVDWEKEISGEHACPSHYFASLNELATCAL